MMSGRRSQRIIRISALLISGIVLICFSNWCGRILYNRWLLYKENIAQNAPLRQWQWTPLPGYPARVDTTSETTHPKLPQLLQKIEEIQATMRTPLIRIQKNNVIAERHPWKVPKIIHQTWKTEQIPLKTSKWVNRWLKLNPDWTYLFWTDSNSLEFIKTYYPTLLSIYTSYTVPVQQADMFRLLVLYTFGGVYADLDIEPLKPLDEIREWSSCMLTSEHDLQTYIMPDHDLHVWANNYTFATNALIACSSHHPFLYYLLSRISMASPHASHIDCPVGSTLYCTGPAIVSLAYGYYTRSVDKETRLRRKEIDVIVCGYEYFLPMYDGSREKIAQDVCAGKKLSEKKQQICKSWKDSGYKNQPTSISFTNHYQVHSYHGQVDEKTIDINKVTQPLIWNRNTKSTSFVVSY